MCSQLLSRADKMMLSLDVWLCMLPLAFAIAFFFGLQAGFITALGLLFVIAALCYVLCGTTAIWSSYIRRNHVKVE
jgi:thiamine transporter ThiT